MPGFDTAATIVSDVALELGLVTSAISNPWAATDQNVVQLTALLKPTGRELVKAHPWSQLMRAGFIDLDGTEPYPFILSSWVTDFGRLVDDTMWNTDGNHYGVATPQQWRQLRATSVSGLTYLMRIESDLIYFDPQPGSGEHIDFNYISRNWGAAAFAKEAPTAATDVIQFDPHLFTRALKLRWLTAKGFDTGAAFADYTAALNAAKGQDGAAPVLSLGGGRRMPYPNVPETGFGQ